MRHSKRSNALDNSMRSFIESGDSGEKLAPDKAE